MLRKRWRCVLVAYLVAGLAGVSWGDDTRHIDRGQHWVRNGKTVLGGFDNMYHATVLPVKDKAYPYRMWFFGWAAADCNPGYSGCDAIYFARGKDLDTWEVYAGREGWDTTQSPQRWVPVVTAQQEIYDAWHNGDPSVVLHKGRFYMAYSATGPNRDRIPYGQAGDKDGDLYCVMGAVSDDGINWRTSEKPLVIHEADIGAAYGPDGTFLNGMYHRPSLLFDRGRWRLWFDYWTGSDVAMGYAEGDADAFLRGSFKVLRADENPLLHEWPNPAVVKIGKKYRAFADPSGYGVGWPGRQLAEAESDDGLNWRILGWIPPDADTPACQVPAPAVLRVGGRETVALFYACQIGGEPYDYRYNRIRYMIERFERKP